MQEQPSSYPRSFLTQQQLGGGGSYEPPKESKKDKKKREEQEKKEQELYDAQLKQIEESQKQADQAARQTQISNRKIKNQELYQSLVANLPDEQRQYASEYDPNKRYFQDSTVSQFGSETSARYQEATSKAAADKKASEEEAARQAEEAAALAMVPPIPSEYNLDTEQARADVTKQEKKKKGIPATILAGETGGYNTSAKTLLG